MGAFEVIFMFLMLTASFQASHASGQSKTILFKLKEEYELMDFVERGAFSLRGGSRYVAREATRAASIAELENVRRVFRELPEPFESKHRRVGAHLYFEGEVSSTTLRREGTLSRALEDTMRRLNRDEAVSMTEIRGDEVMFDYVPDDSLYYNQPFLKLLNMETAWTMSLGDERITVAVIDSGSTRHEDLIPNIWRNKDVINRSRAGLQPEWPDNCENGRDDDGNGYVDDCHGYNFGDDDGRDLSGSSNHGTHVAGTVAARTNNALGVAGVAGGGNTRSGASLMILTTFGRSRQRGFGEAHFYAADNGAIIAQESWGYSEDGAFPVDVKLGIDYFNANARGGIASAQNVISNGGIVVFAAGNSNSADDYYPGYYAGVVNVGAASAATRDRDNTRRASYSNKGPHIDVSATGSAILSTIGSTQYGLKSGTSMAAPQVSGIFALLLSLYPGSSKENYISCVYGTSTFFDRDMGNGLIDGGGAVQCIKDLSEREGDSCANWSQWSSCQLDCNVARNNRISRTSRGTLRTRELIYANNDITTIQEDEESSFMTSLARAALETLTFQGRMTYCECLQLASRYTESVSISTNAIQSIQSVASVSDCVTTAPVVTSPRIGRGRTSSTSRLAAHSRQLFASIDVNKDGFIDLKEGERFMYDDSAVSYDNGTIYSDPITTDLIRIYGEQSKFRVSSGAGCPSATIKRPCAGICNTDPSINPTPDNPNSGYPGCFPGYSKILMKDGSQKMMKDLEYGDEVATVTKSQPGTLLQIDSSPILAFSHRDGEMSTIFSSVIEVHVMVDSDRSTTIDPHREIILELTYNHLLPVTISRGDDHDRTRLLPARLLEKGMKVKSIRRKPKPLDDFSKFEVITSQFNVPLHEYELISGEIVKVVEKYVEERFFAPMTISNNIIVDGVVVACSTEKMFFSSKSDSISTDIIDATRDVILSSFLTPLYVMHILKQSLYGAISTLSTLSSKMK